MIARERLIEIAVSVAGVGIMVAFLYFVGASHTEAVNDHQVLSPAGGELIVYGIVGFIVLMSLVGLFLIRTVTVVEAENGNDGDSSGA